MECEQSNENARKGRKHNNNIKKKVMRQKKKNCEYNGDFDQFFIQFFEIQFNEFHQIVMY